MHEFMTRGGVSSPMHRALLAEAADHLTAPHESRPMCQTHAGAGEGMALGCDREAAGGDSGCEDTGQGEGGDGRQRVLQGHYVVGWFLPDGTPIEAAMSPDAAWAIVAHAHVAVWDEAVASAASAGPLPLASAEPWEEADAEYRARLNRAIVPLSVKCMDSQLDTAGRQLGLPRARLAPVATPRVIEEDRP